ncbi:MAG: M23 family metallopeptidase [Alphaproteobacteria bacterium]|nr:M23 family metallopeptidase [Alphaproteobacteria bacterium]
MGGQVTAFRWRRGGKSDTRAKIVFGWRTLKARYVRLLGTAALGMALVGCGSNAPAPVVVKPPFVAMTAAEPVVATRQAGEPGAPAQTVIVGAGETIYTIARRYNVSPRVLIEANNLKPPYGVTPGKQVTIPGSRLHTVAEGESLYLISRAYDVDMHSLAKANKLALPYRVYGGQKLAIPGIGVGQAKPAVEVASVEEVLANTPPRPRARAPADAGSAAQQSDRTPATPPEQKAAAEPPAPPPVGSGNGRFLWPVRGRVISAFGPKDDGLYNDGINIAAKPGDVVRAAEAGVVAYAGNELRGLGNLLLIRHKDGWMTAYAHADELAVARGDTVQRGQAIARVGVSGGVKEPQLHFELRKGAKAVDPLRYLGSAT